MNTDSISNKVTVILLKISLIEIKNSYFGEMFFTVYVQSTHPKIRYVKIILFDTFLSQKKKNFRRAHQYRLLSIYHFRKIMKNISQVL